MTDKKVEIQIVIDEHGIDCVRIVGEPEAHPEAHEIYFKICDLIAKWDSEIKERLNKEEKVVDVIEKLRTSDL